MGQDVELAIGDKKMRPEELSALIIKKVKATARDYFQLSETETIRAVITVPAYFTEQQRQATRQAAELAGLELERIINEPTAAALAFGMSSLEEAIYAVYDLGGGTFDISVIESENGIIEVLATTGNNELGGDDFDEALAAFIWTRFLKSNKLSGVKKDRRTAAKLLQLAESAKIHLSTEQKYTISESFFFSYKKQNYHLETIITKKEFEELISNQIDQTVELLKQAVKDAKLKIDEVDGILLVGGSSRIPLVKERIEAATGILPQLMDLPDEAVAHGAAVQGAIIDKKEIDAILVDITPYSLGVGAMDDIAHQSIMETINNYDKPEDFEPNLGASVLIKKNNPVPVRQKRLFYASGPFQKKFQIRVFQGEKDRFKDNKQIGECFLELEKPPEYPEVEIEFHLDINGILNIEAVETATKKKVNATFQSSRGQKIRKELLEETIMVSSSTADNLLIKRAENLLASESLSEEDTEDLKDLIEQYKTEQLSDNQVGLESTKTELLDLLFYLEGNS